MEVDEIFENKILVQIAIGKHDFQLNFHDGLNLVISDTISFVEDNGASAEWSQESGTVNLELFLRLLNEKVLGAKFSKKEGLQVQFANAKILVPKPKDDFEYLHVKSDEMGIYIY